MLTANKTIKEIIYGNGHLTVIEITRVDNHKIKNFTEKVSSLNTYNFV